MGRLDAHRHGRAGIPVLHRRRHAAVRLELLAAALLRAGARFGAPRFDPVGSWPSVIDRAVIGVQHFFPHWPVDGKVVFDPEGILSTWPSCFNVLLGALAGLAYSRGTLARPAISFIAAGAAMMVLSMLLTGDLSDHQEPLDQHLRAVQRRLRARAARRAHARLAGPVVRPALWPARIFGENPLLAYILVFLAAPLIDAQWLGTPDGTDDAAQRRPGVVQHVRRAARGLAAVRALRHRRCIFASCVVCHRRRWILKLYELRRPWNLIDIGANLAHDSFDADRDASCSARPQAGVAQIVVTGSSEESTRKAIELVARASRRVVRHGRRASASRRGSHRRHPARAAGAGARQPRGRGRRMRARLFSRLLPARPAAPRLRLAARARRRHRQARVPASARCA